MRDAFRDRLVAMVVVWRGGVGETCSFDCVIRETSSFPIRGHVDSRVRTHRKQFQRVYGAFKSPKRRCNHRLSFLLVNKDCRRSLRRYFQLKETFKFYVEFVRRRGRRKRFDRYMHS